MNRYFAAATVFFALLGQSPAQAVYLKSGLAEIKLVTQVQMIQYTRGGSREFRRCMRAKYGPRYFSRVPRAIRYHMASACGG
jgi:hypothetical protein